jgi:hypothetical protein
MAVDVHEQFVLLFGQHGGNLSPQAPAALAEQIGN